MKKIIKTCAAWVCAAVLALSACPVMAGAEEEVMPSGKKVDVLANYLERGRSELGEDCPAEVQVVLHGDETVMQFIFGKSDIAKGIPADEETVYDWGSVTKTMVWISVLQLWEQGMLDLDADIRTYLPDDFFRNLAYDEPITMLNLMNHTAGWSEPLYSFNVRLEDGDKIPTLEEGLRACEPAQVYRPGEVIAYSNWGSALAGFIVERISGMPFSEYAHRNILDPLGMEHTSVAADLSDNPWVRERRMQVQSYRMTISLSSLYEPLQRNMEYISLYPCGSAVGTIGDLTLYAKGLISEDAPLFRNKETQAMLFSGSEFYDGTDIPVCSYGFWPGAGQSGLYFGHNGFSGFHGADMWLDPVTKYGYISLTTNTNGALPMRDWVFGTADADDYPAVDDALPELKGYYVSARTRAAGPGVERLLYSAAPLYTAQIENGEAFGMETSIRHLGGDTYAVADDSGKLLCILSERHYQDGSKGMRLATDEHVQVPFYLGKVCLLTAYFIAAAAAFFALLIQLKLMRARRLKGGACMAVQTAAQLARIVSVITLIVFIALNSSYEESSTFVISREGIIASCVIQIVCAVLLAAGIPAACTRLLGKRTATEYLSAIGSLAGNAVSLAAIICFSMYRFWGC